MGVDLAKNVFQVHEAEGTGRAVQRKKLRRAQVLEFFGQLPAASWRCKPASALISGVVRSAGWAMTFG